ncbi:unnamed protein product [Brachionus calyciflorus]|uniref:MAM domain-containing protein n=1 Tax=Brachionus calyciflorus TaxID=104777 RepID=A0A814HSJ7_9BILA|nr:unnamed protein product [Brachionus calyciflorus]
MSESLLYILSALFLIKQISCSTSQISCNFDSDWCNFVPNKFFVRYTGVSPSPTSGPDEDRTGDGYYALCNGKLLQNPSDKCLLNLNLTLLKETDFKFWYHMSGLQIGTLELILNESEIIWSLTGRQKNEWLLTELKLPPGDYNLEFSANRSVSGRYSSDIALDDIYLDGQPLTTQQVTVTRTTALPILNISTNFDTIGNLNGWHTNFDRNKWIQTNGLLNLQLGLPGPGSDWSSITTNLKNITSTRPLNIPCTLPYAVSIYPDRREFYCQKFPAISKTNTICGLGEFPNLSSGRLVASCTLGNYMMITSEKFDSEMGVFRSRFYSPVFKLPANIDEFCIGFKYNILTSSNDGFRLYVENYLFQEQFNIVFTKRGPLKEDRWYSVEVPVRNINYEQIIMFFEPIRGQNRDYYASISIDSVVLEYRSCELVTEEVLTTEPIVTTIQTINQESSTNTNDLTSEYLHSTLYTTLNEPTTLLYTNSEISTPQTFIFETTLENTENLSLTTAEYDVITITSSNNNETDNYETTTDKINSEMTTFQTTTPKTQFSSTTFYSNENITTSIYTTSSNITTEYTTSQNTSTNEIRREKRNNTNLYLAIFIPLGVIAIVVLLVVVFGKKYKIYACQSSSSKSKQIKKNDLEMF